MFIFAHGDSSGLLLDGKHITYPQLASMASMERANSIYLVACESAAIEMYDKTDIFEGIVGDVDAIVAGLAAALLVAQLGGWSDLVFHILSELWNRKTELHNGERPYLLAETESSYQIAYKRDYITKKNWAGIPYFWENILWFNLDKYWCSLYFDLFGTLSGVIALVGMISKASLNPVIGIIALALFIHARTVKMTGNQRVQGDCKAGVSGELYLPYRHSFWYDFGNDDAGLDGQFKIPVGFLGYQVFISLNSIPTTWVPIKA